MKCGSKTFEGSNFLLPEIANRMESLQNQALALSRSERHIKSVLTELWLEILLGESGGFRLVQKHARLQCFGAFDGCKQTKEL